MPTTSSDAIRVGALTITFVLDAETSGGCATAFECDVPANAVMPAPHSHDGFEEINYGLTGVTTFMVDGERRELHPGGVVFIPRGAVHAFENRASGDAKFLAVTAGRVRTRVLRGGRRRARRDRRRTARPRRDRRGHAPSRPHPGIRVNA